MNLALRHWLGLLAGFIFFSTFGFAVCSGSSRQTSLAGYALSPDTTRIAALAQDGTLFWWDVASGKRTELVECIRPQAFDHPILFSPDSNRIAVAVEDAIHIFDISTGKEMAKLTSPKVKLTSLEHPDPKETYKITFSGDGLRLAASYEAGSVVWQIGSQAEVAFIPAHSICKALALNSGGTVLALGCWDGLHVRRLLEGGTTRRLDEGLEIESVLFAHGDQWIVALTATPLPQEPKQRVRKYRREIAVLDSTTCKKLKTFKTDADLDELRFGLASGGSHLLLASDFKDRLWAWDLDTGDLKATWKTSSGHPSGDGKFLLREGGAPGRLELWRVGSPDPTARVFTYKSPLCAESFADDKGNIRVEDLFIADGVSGDDEPFGSLSIRGYVAQDCSRVNISLLRFKTEERARQEFEYEIGQAAEVLEKGPPKDAPLQALLGERRVLRQGRRGPALGPFAVIWLEGTSLIRIDSSSLPVALAMENRILEKK